MLGVADESEGDGELLAFGNGLGAAFDRTENVIDLVGVFHFFNISQAVVQELPKLVPVFLGVVFFVQCPEPVLQVFLGILLCTGQQAVEGLPQGSQLVRVFHVGLLLVRQRPVGVFHRFHSCLGLGICLGDGQRVDGRFHVCGRVLRLGKDGGYGHIGSGHGEGVASQGHGFTGGIRYRQDLQFIADVRLGCDGDICSCSGLGNISADLAVGGARYGDGVLGHTGDAHVIEAALFRGETPAGNQGVEGLLRGHLVEFAVLRMGKAPILEIERCQAVQQRLAVFGELRIFGGVPAQLGQGHQNLRDGLGGGRECAVCHGAVILHLPGQERQGIVHGGFYFGAVCGPGPGNQIVGSQGLDDHGRGIQIAAAGGDGPAAVGVLAVQKTVNQVLFVGGAVIRRPQSQQGEGRAGAALLRGPGGIAEGLQQIITLEVGGVIAQGRQSQGNSGIVRGLVPVQLSGVVDFAFDVRFDCGKIVRLLSLGGFLVQRPGQAEHQPLALDRAGGGVGGQQGLRRLVIDIHKLRFLERGKRRLRRSQNRIVLNKRLLRIGQRVIRCSGRGDRVRAFQRDWRADRVDQRFNRIRSYLIGIGLQLNFDIGQSGKYKVGGRSIIHPLAANVIRLVAMAARCSLVETSQPNNAIQYIRLIISPIFRNRNRYILLFCTAAEVINTIFTSGIRSKRFSILIPVFDFGIEVIEARQLFCGIGQTAELQFDGVARANRNIRCQSVSFFILNRIADLTRSDDLIICQAILFDSDDMTAGGQAGYGDHAIVCYGDTFIGKAPEGHGSGDNRAVDRDSAAALRLEGVFCPCVIQIEQRVMLCIQCGRFSTCAIQEHIRLNR